MPEGKNFYSTGDIARMLNVSPTTIFRAIEKKRLPASTTPGGHYRISRENLEEFLRENKIPLNVLEPRSRKVLIVEDNPAEKRLFERAISDDVDLEVRSTSSGYEAGFLTKSFKPDLIVLDIYLGDGDGRQILRLIRSDPALKRTKILVVSGIRDHDELEDIRAAGVDDILNKPVSVAVLRQKVRKLLG